MSSIAKVIEIVALPHGNAPESIRAAWVGCVFPTNALECGHVPQYVEPIVREKRTGGIPATEYLANPEKFAPQKIDGFSVNQAVAIAELERHDKKAADWFRGRGFPLRGGGFRFMLNEVKVLEYYTQDELLKMSGKLVVADDMETGTMRPML